MRSKPEIKWLIFGLSFLALLLIGVRLTRAAEVKRTPPPFSFQIGDMDSIHSLLTLLVTEPERKGTLEILLTQQVGTATKDAIKAEALVNPLAFGTPTVGTPIPTPILPTAGLGYMPTGIIKGDYPEAHLYYINPIIDDRWIGFIMNQRYIVYAGAKSDDPLQGILIVIVVPANGSNQQFQTYLAPVKSGSLAIQSESKGRLTITTKGGDTIYFDVPSQSFISSLTALSPATTTPITYVTATPFSTAPPILNNNNPAYPYP